MSLVPSFETCNTGQRNVPKCVIVTLATLNCLNSLKAALRPSPVLTSADSKPPVSRRETMEENGKFSRQRRENISGEAT